MPYSKEQIDALFSELPADVKEAITSVDTMDIINELKEKYKLHIDQIGQLSAQITLVMAGAASPDRFISDIESSMRISKETAQAITGEVNEKIFRTIRNTLKDIQLKERPEELKKESKNAVPQKPIVTDPYREPI